MNRKELVRQMAQDNGISLAQAARLLAQILDGIQGALAEGETLYLPNFGVFELRYRLTTDNPDRPVSVLPAFKPANALKAAVKAG